VKSIGKYSRILVVGLGKRSGLAACNFLINKGCTVSASDSKSPEALRDILKELSTGVRIFAGNQDPDILNEGFDLIVLSPGVPKSIPLIQAAIQKNIPVIAEVELAYLNMKGMLVAVTGTDGKSTTTTLTGHILNDLKIKTFMGGNLGTPFISFAGDTDADSVSVVELSSFQLETIDTLKADAAVIMNVTPDHLDRYAGMDEYLNAKLRVSKNQGPDDFYVYRKDDARLRDNLGRINAKKLSFSISEQGADAFVKDGAVYVKRSGKAVKVLETADMTIIGAHNIENAMASILLVSSILDKKGIEPDYAMIGKSCCSFKGLAHRMELLGKIKGRTFINDSKATTVGAVEMALKSIPDESILILGGRTKGDDYSRLHDKIKEKIKHLILIGESTPEFKKIYADIPGSIAVTLDDAVKQAIDASVENDVIILSPACASFDMFMSFEDRGDKFRQAVRKIKEA
jgi:UDP-N-acetylmuramoylalanine--D-glutamate ligase